MPYPDAQVSQAAVVQPASIEVSTLTTYQIRLHGPSGELEVEMHDTSPEECLDQLQAWMRDATHVELKTRRGTARVNMGHVWAIEFIPSGRTVSG